MAATVKGQLSNENVGRKLASPVSSAEESLFINDEAETSSTIEQDAFKQSLQFAALDRELATIGEKWSQPCFNEKLGRTVTFAEALLRELFEEIRHEPDDDRKFRLELNSGLLHMLLRLRQKAVIPADFVRKTSLKLLLGRVRVARWGFSVMSRLLAEALFQRCERQEWGEPAGQASSPSPAGQGNNQKNKRKRDALSPRARTRKEQKTKVPVDEIHIKKPIPADDDPVFGLAGPMRGTLIKYNTTDPHNVSKSLVLNPQTQQVNSKVHGDNGIPVGQIYLRQMAALAQGAHGSSQAGIAGTAEDGVYSVIVTGRYKGLEKDGLTRFEYCATGSMDNTFKDALVESQGLKALRTSLTTRNPVRVLRGQNEDFVHAPAFGLRYDGLYTVVSEKRRKNPRGGLYAVFVLERLEEQEPVDLGRPNAEDLEQLNQLKVRLGVE